MVNDPGGKAQHELDVVALARGAWRGSTRPTVVAVGEAKATGRRRGLGDLDRLARIRELLVRRGSDAASAHLVLFSRDGFADALADLARGRGDVHLVTVEDLYAG